MYSASVNYAEALGLCWTDLERNVNKRRLDDRIEGLDKLLLRPLICLTVMSVENLIKVAGVGQVSVSFAVSHQRGGSVFRVF